jgi:(p)ppGpp synthase/HD superfamily hydrolase
MRAIDKALAMALRAHAGQTDLAGKPYILHPLRLAAKHPDSELKTIVALLHDVVEDTFGKENQVTVHDIKDEFDSIVAIAVDHLTRGKQGMVPFSGETYIHDELYFDEYMQRVVTNPLAIIIKRDDLADNMNLTRLPHLNDAAISRMKRYHKALRFLEESEHRIGHTWLRQEDTDANRT